MQKIDPTEISKLQNLVQNDDVADALQRIIEMEGGGIFKNQAIELLGRHSKTSKEEQRGTLFPSERPVFFNQIRQETVELISLLDAPEKLFEALLEKYQLPSLPFPCPDHHFSRQANVAGFKKELFPDERKPFDWIVEIERNPKIALLANAGMGKTHELRWLCHHLKENGQYLPIFEYLRDKKYLRDLPKIPAELEEKTVLVLDGMDESDMAQAKNAIENFHARHPKAKIVVSCRSNAYANTLEKFQVFHLERLSQLQIEQYVKQELGRTTGERFLENWRKRYPWHESQLIDIPFFLVSICDFVKDKKQAAPESLAEVFEYLIEKSIERRLKSVAKFGSGDHEKHWQALRHSLEKLAFAMELRGENQFSWSDFEQIFTDEQAQIELLEKSSLLEIRGNAVQFAHNNFQEFLAARVLSRATDFKTILDAIAVPPDFERLNWSWTNALAFLFSIWSDENPMKLLLLDRLTKFEIGVLVKIGSFEKERFSPPVRQQILEKVFADCKREGLIVGYRHYNYWELAEFAESPGSLRFLTKELTNAENTLVKSNALVLLKSMDIPVPPDVQTELREALRQNIFDFENNNETVRHFAMDTLLQLFDEMAEGTVAAFFDSDSAHERTSVCRAICKKGLQKTFMAQLIRRSKELEDPDWEKGKISLAYESWQLEQCFEALKTEADLVCYFENYAALRDDEDRWGNREKYVAPLLQKLAAAELSPAAAQKIFVAMRDAFAEMVGFISRSDKASVSQFLEKNKLEFQFLHFCVEQGKRIDSSSQFLNEEGVDFLIGKFQDGQLERVWLENYISWSASYKNSWLPVLVERLNLLGGQAFEIPQPAPPIDYAEQERKRHLAEKQMFFDKEKLMAAVCEIFEIQGTERLEKGKFYDHLLEAERYDRDVFEKYPHALRWFLDDRSHCTLDEILQEIEKNWDWISIQQTKIYLSREQRSFSEHPELGLADAEIAIVRNWCDRHASGLNGLGEEEANYGNIAFAWFTIFCKFKHYDEQIYLRMIDSPLQNHVSEKLLDFLETEEVLPFQKIKKEVLKVMGRGDAQGWKFYKYLEFLKKHRCTEALDFLPKYVEEKTGQSDNRDFALQAFIELGGDRQYLLDLLLKITPEPNDNREYHLLAALLKNPDEALEKIFLQKLAQSDQPEQQLVFARHLLGFGNLAALQFLVNFIERERKSPFSRDMDQVEHRFENPAGLSLLLRFFDFGRDESIPQDLFAKILDVGKKMLHHLATCQNGKYFDLVRQSLRQHLQTQTWLNESGDVKNALLTTTCPEALTDIRYFIKDLGFHFFQRRLVSLDEALKLFKRLEVAPNSYHFPRRGDK